VTSPQSGGSKTFVSTGPARSSSLTSSASREKVAELIDAGAYRTRSGELSKVTRRRRPAAYVLDPDG